MQCLHIGIAKLLIENGASINNADNNGITLLHLAVVMKNEEISKLLIEKGAHINATDKRGRTPLYESINYVDIEVTKLLIEKVQISRKPTTTIVFRHGGKET
ncbi:Ankyrin repeats (3 copies) [Popillia japonica]|uniref:Ankyrin repeats (3 copies) n=1 Tax=Popillia japonica TaxID=7064 RepID=A0AAW1L8Q4_POPJA